MRIEEFRIGNFVEYENKLIKVEDIYDYGCINEDLHYEIDIKECKGIGITEEILLSIEGVKQLNEYQYKLYDWFMIERYTTKEKWSVRKVISEDSSILLCFIDFLHELQNITFSLTNKELEINL